MAQNKPKYVLSYFPVKALGEPIRLLLSYGNIEFEDRRITKEEWPKYKETMPAGQMPVLQIGDKVLFQSTAISRYLAKQVGLAGDNDWEAVQIDIAIDTIHDLRLKIIPVFYEADENIKEGKYPQLLTEIIPYYVKKLEEMAKVNKGHLALGKLTWADFVFAGIIDYLNVICRQNIIANNPNLAAVVENVKSLPAIKAWYAKAPATEF